MKMIIKKKVDFNQLNFVRTREELKAELDDLINHVVQEFYQPKENNLKERPA